MSFSVHPITPSFAAEIGDLDLSVPLSEPTFAALDDAFNTYSVLVFGGQALSEDAQMDFSARFGPLETTIQSFRKGVKLRLGPKFADVSNLDADNEVLPEDSERRHFNSGNRLWHTDSSFRPVPAKCSLLYASSIPPVGGQTEFADLRAAYDALSDEMMNKIEGLIAEHSIMTSRAKMGFTDFLDEERERFAPVPQAITRTIPQSGRKTLYIASHIGRIMGMTDEDAAALTEELLAHATQPQFVQVHRWRVNDLVIWDDRCTMHKGGDFDDLRYRRDMQRATVSDIANSCEQEGLQVDAA